MTKTGQNSRVNKGGSSGRQPTAGRPSSSSRTRKGGTVSKARPKPARKVSGGSQYHCPDWLQKVLALLFSCAMLYVSYIVLIRPYSYRWRPCHGSQEYDVCLPLNYSVIGIDVSHHQGDIQWGKMNPEGCQHPLKFVFIKATEGGDFKDENYEKNLAGAREAGLACGSYLFFNPSTPASAQADFFIRNVSLMPGDLPPVIDVERRGNSPQSLQKSLLECLRILENHYGVRPIVYSSYRFRKRYLDNPLLDEFPAWMAHYYVEEPEEDADWLLWQFTDRGVVDGIEGYSDLNVFNGSEAEFRNLTVKSVR